MQKQLLINQERLFEGVKQHEIVLDHVERGIGKIERNHPELVGLKRKVGVLKKLIHHDLTQQPLPALPFLHQMLNSWFQISTVISGDFGRASWEFAQRLALIQTAPSEDLFLNWQKRIDELNQFCSEKGPESFLFWLNTPPKDAEEAQRQARLKPLFNLQTSFIDHLEHFILPFAEKYSIPDDFFKRKDVIDLTPYIRPLPNLEFVQWTKEGHLLDPAIAFYSSLFSRP